MKPIIWIVVGGLLVLAFFLVWPTSVQSQEFVQDGGQWVSVPCDVHTQMWAKLLWDAGFDLGYTDEAGFGFP